MNTEKKSERVRVFVRIRPFNSQELKLDDSSPIRFIDQNKNTLTCKKIIFIIINYNYSPKRII